MNPEKWCEDRAASILASPNRERLAAELRNAYMFGVDDAKKNQGVPDSNTLNDRLDDAVRDDHYEKVASQIAATYLGNKSYPSEEVRSTVYAELIDAYRRGLRGETPYRGPDDLRES